MNSKIIACFSQLFAADPLVVFAPGRINLIGEHTDYQEGFVFPAAVKQGIWAGITKNELGLCRLYSLDFDQEFSFELDSMSPKKGHWATYVMGICTLFKQAGYRIKEFDLVIGGNLPLGAGLSSSAALSVAVGLGISEAFDLHIPKKDLARYAQKAEQLFAGVNCGIMDPYSSVFGQEGKAMLLDCRSQSHDYLPVKLGEYKLVLVHSKVSHSLAASAYNQRRSACEESVSLLQTTYPELLSLRDLSLTDLPKVKYLLPAGLFPKAKHVISECSRVLEAAKALSRNDLVHLGQLLKASHQSLSQDFEVSCVELDFLAQEVIGMEGVLGARMMGGGFGGCLLGLVKESAWVSIQEKITAAYQKKYLLTPDFIEVAPGGGAQKI
ncbi:MAG: galactokinase [Bacteroidetes bacterium]|nr:galactokinase [Bacteroidota bacterium]MDA1269203.1 galactokinase [Bacteroidota bacterium]